MKVKVRKKRTNAEIEEIIADGLIKLKERAYSAKFPWERQFERELCELFGKYSNGVNNVFDICTYVMSDLSHSVYGINENEKRIFKHIFGVDFFELFNDWDDMEYYEKINKEV